MTEIPGDIREFFKVAESDQGLPVYYLWVFDPDTGEVIVEHNEGVDPIEVHDHGDLARLVANPNRVHGYAYRIRGGWRITDWEHKPLGDPFILKRVVKSLDQGEKVSRVARTFDPR
jgi:hypothetical protein